jgi:hypothetical protein
MQRVRFGIVALALSLVFVASYGAFIVWRFEHRLPPQVRRPVPLSPDVASVSSDLCRIAHAQQAFFASVGHYATRSELFSNGDITLTGDRFPYRYSVQTPTPARFVVVASASLAPLEGRAPAIVVDDTLQVCVLKASLPDFRWRRDHPPDHWGDGTDYDCNRCP